MNNSFKEKNRDLVPIKSILQELENMFRVKLNEYLGNMF